MKSIQDSEWLFFFYRAQVIIEHDDKGGTLGGNADLGEGDTQEWAEYTTLRGPSALLSDFVPYVLITFSDFLALSEEVQDPLAEEWWMRMRNFPVSDDCVKSWTVI